MAKVRDKVTRFDAALFDDAAVEGRRQSRSATQQLDHWARLGRALSGAASPARFRVDLALAGQVSLAGIDESEGVALNAEVTASIEELLEATSYGDELAAAGIVTVSLEDGELIQHLPDGSTSVLPAPGRAIRG